jgi:hypothetical protein
MAALLVSFLLALIIALPWAKGVSDMHEKHPDYKGEDFLNNDL